jgi:hypothetical protein
MALRPKNSAAGSTDRPASKAMDDAINALANELADRPFDNAPKVSNKPRPYTISLPAMMIEALEDAATANKRAGRTPKTASHIIRDLLDAAGYGKSHITHHTSHVTRHT